MLSLRRSRGFAPRAAVGPPAAARLCDVVVPRFTFLALLSVGIATAAIDFGYGVLFAGVPYPDPTPEQLRDDDAALRVSERMMLAGAATAALAAPVAWIRRLQRKRREDPR